MKAQKEFSSTELQLQFEICGARRERFGGVKRRLATLTCIILNVLENSLELEKV